MWFNTGGRNRTLQQVEVVAWGKLLCQNEANCHWWKEDSKFGGSSENSFAFENAKEQNEEIELFLKLQLLKVLNKDRPVDETLGVCRCRVMEDADEWFSCVNCTDKGLQRAVAALDEHPAARQTSQLVELKKVSVRACVCVCQSLSVSQSVRA